MEIRIRPRHKKVLYLVSAAVLLLALLALLANAQLRPALMQLAQTRAHDIAANAMYEAVLASLNEQPADISYVDILKTDDQVFYVEVNNRELSRLAALCATAVRQRLLSEGQQGVRVRMGTLTGLPLFAGAGPDIRMTFAPESSVQASFSSEFRTAGINQTQHRIQMQLSVQIAVILPGSTQLVQVQTAVPVAEHIIVGKVPDAYTDVNNQKDMLHLIPSP